MREEKKENPKEGMSGFLKFVVIVLVAILLFKVTIALVDYCSLTPFERAIKSIQVVASPAKDELKTIIRNLLEQEGVEVEEIAISSGYIDGKTYITVHVLSEDEEYHKYNMEGYLNPIVYALKGDLNPDPNVWEGYTFDFENVSFRLDGYTIIIEWGYLKEPKATPLTERWVGFAGFIWHLLFAII